MNNYKKAQQKKFQEVFEQNLLDGNSIHDDTTMLNHREVFNVLEPLFMSSLTELLEKAKECVPEYINNRNVNSKSYEIDLGHDGCIEKFLQALDNLTKI